MNSKKTIVSMKNITKSFAGVKALDNVNLDILSGNVHGLIGANGAGKSTLIKILAGAYSLDSGEIEIAGKATQINNPHHAGELGLSFIHQELNLVENFNVMENITLGLAKDKKAGFIDWKSISKKLEKIAEKIGFKPPLNTPVKDLSVADKWLVAIARALYQQARVIAMDEPTASLSEEEVVMLFGVIRDLTAAGIGVIYVSHRLDEIMEICDEVTVFKDGTLVMYSETKNTTKAKIINAIAGYDVEALKAEDIDFSGKDIVFRACEVKDEKMVANVSLELHKGEVLGIGGLVGAGRTELIKLIYGANKCTGGSMELLSKPYYPKKPEDAVKHGIVIVPEERRSEGLITNQSVKFNINLPNLKKLRGKSVLLSNSKAKNDADEVIEKLKVKTSGPNAQILSLSGGNQQKVVIGRWMKSNPCIILMDEPTRGVDIGARAEIYKLIRNMSKDGISFIIVSSDVEELPGLCDRVFVMANGVVSGELKGTAITKDAILRLSYAN